MTMRVCHVEDVLGKKKILLSNLLDTLGSFGCNGEHGGQGNRCTLMAVAPGFLRSSIAEYDFTHATTRQTLQIHEVD
jgi:hypothetical protein